MRRRRLSRSSAAALAACLTAVSVALGAAAAPSGRQPVPGGPDGVQFFGWFERGRGSMALLSLAVLNQDRTAIEGIHVAHVGGAVPATCRDRSGKTVTPARGGSISVNGHTRGAPIGPGGAFAFRLRPAPQDIQGGLAPFDLAIRGTFHGNNVVGRVRGTSGKGGPFASCKADARFWAWRVR